jgi:hypothetical protein
VSGVGSGVIYAGLIVLWGAYFIPRWLRRHEELSEARSVERFAAAMRILSRREKTPDQRWIVMPPRPQDAEDEGSYGRRSRRRFSLRLRRRDEHRPRARRGSRWSRWRRRRAHRRPVSLAVRRRRVVALLLLGTVVAAGLAPVTALPWWSPLVVLGLLGLDLVHLRAQARRRHELSRSRDAVRARTRSRLARFDSVERIVEARREHAERRAAAAALATAEREAAELEAHAEAERLAAAAAGWQPVPVPLPTYVTKPTAPRPPGTVDLSRPGAWTAAHLRASPALPAPSPEEPFDQTAVPAQRDPVTDPTAPVAASDEVDELDAILERRAVND